MQLKKTMRGMAMAMLMAGCAISTPARAQSAQHLFDSATTALDAKEFDRAIEIFTALEQRTRDGDQGIHALIQLRLGEALIGADRTDAAVPWIESGVAYYEEKGVPENLKYDIWAGQLALAGHAYADAAFEEALLRYSRAETVAPGPVERMAALQGKVRANLVFDPAKALSDTETVLGLAEGLPLSDEVKAINLDLQGRALLNLDRFDEALARFKRAGEALGGMRSNRVSFYDVIIRNDAGIAAFLKGDERAARTFLASSGYGRGDTTELGISEGVPLPLCGGPNNLRPEDVFIAEFSLANDGSVAGVQPVYSNRSGPAFVEFLTAVKAWSWPETAIADLHPIFRATVRLELHCSNSVPRPTTRGTLAAEVAEWWQGHGLGEPPMGGKFTQGGKVYDDRISTRERIAAFDGLIAELEAIGAPAPVMAQALLDRPSRNPRQAAQQRRSVALDERFQQDPGLRARLALIYVDELPGGKDRQDAIAMLRRVTEDPALAPNDPNRVGALIRLASLLRAEDELDAAAAAYAATGLSPSQCAELAVQPKVTGYSAAPSNTYPREAILSGISGWSTVEYDVSADGRAESPRVVASFPPLIFQDAAAKLLSYAEFEESYRPEGGKGCSGAINGVQFDIE